jgi:hypothetical protein
MVELYNFPKIAFGAHFRIVRQSTTQFLCEFQNLKALVPSRKAEKRKGRRGCIRSGGGERMHPRSEESGYSRDKLSIPQISQSFRVSLIIRLTNQTYIRFKYQNPIRKFLRFLLNIFLLRKSGSFCKCNISIN